MKIGIMGTRGIPNNYGGFEQFTEFLSTGLVDKGHEVYVYNPHTHPYQKSIWKGVHIIHKHDPENKIGTAGQFIYDLNCIIDSRKRKFDVLLNLGYTSSSIWGLLFPKKSIIMTNMDGLEWKRSKYSRKIQAFLKFAEKLAVNHSNVLIADSIGIQNYLLQKYKVKSHFIPYGADHFNAPDANVLEAYQIKPFSYNMLIARMEPENNVETILDGVHNSSSTFQFLVIGNFKNKFGTYLSEKYKEDARIIFLGPIYDMKVVNNIRHFSNLYFHGHSVGGTNPSLLEAMASSSLICAHENEFNRYILNDDAFYFKTHEDVSKIITQKDIRASSQKMINNNLIKIQNTYSWENIINQYEQVMLNSI